MVKVIYTRAVGKRGRYAFVGGDEMSYEYKDINSEAEFQQIKNDAVDELKDPDTSLVKVSFYTETNVPFEISYDDINTDDEEFCNIDEVTEMTLEKILADKESMPRWMWEMFNGQHEEGSIPDTEDENVLNEYFKQHGALLK